MARGPRPNPVRGGGQRTVGRSGEKAVRRRQNPGNE